MFQRCWVDEKFGSSDDIFAKTCYLNRSRRPYATGGVPSFSVPIPRYSNTDKNKACGRIILTFSWRRRPQRCTLPTENTTSAVADARVKWLWNYANFIPRWNFPTAVLLDFVFCP